MRNIQLIIEYDGSNYCGWQRQNNGISIQQKIEEALEIISGEKLSITGAGRTDAGVHAYAQSANFYTESKIPIDKFPFAVNSALPSDIAVIKAYERDESFNSRYSAIEKTYIYKIYNRRIPSPFYARYAYHCPVDINIEKMIMASKQIIGKHDFTSFMATGGQVKSTVRDVYDIDIYKEGDIITISVRGNGFLYNMVRIISGTLLYAGIGKIDPSDIEKIIDSKDRTLAGITLPACGLYLKEIVY
ncbi:MAG: tRNA pseudouridine(38-40) synthase TruA [Eubacteriaceae bacterium]|nr:tRNA pseudouridine(38-40) synthase TruA [Eubacteriaceae bacterium]